MNGKSILDLSTEDVEKNFRVNLLSHYHTVQTFLPGMLEAERGTIVTVASVLGYVGCANLCMFSAASVGINTDPNSSGLYRSQGRSGCLSCFVESRTQLLSSPRGGEHQDGASNTWATGDIHVWWVEDTFIVSRSDR